MSLPAEPALLIPRCFPTPGRGAALGGRPACDPWPEEDLRAGLSDGIGASVAGLLPAMVCGEESAVLVFENESRRVGSDLFAQSQATLDRISREEEGHERVLRGLAERLPEPAHARETRRLARRFFAGLRTPDIGEHFSRIGWLDSGVCIIFARLLDSPGLADAAPLRRALQRILREEAGHVAFSRRYAERLGADMLQDRESFLRVRGGLIDVLRPCGGALEELGVDADALFADLRGRRFDGARP